MASYLVAAFYKFVPLTDHTEQRDPLLGCCRENQVLGTLILAPEGINGTIAGPPEGVGMVLATLRQDQRLVDLEVKQALSSVPPFTRLKVQLKKEIVTLGMPEVDPTRVTGTHVKPEDWNALLDDPDVVVVDTRNDYEISIGTFEGATDPRIGTFRDLPAWFEQQWDEGRRPKIAMFCTGGIRCEKASSLLREQGGNEVFQLEGGILKYLEQVPPEESRWRGDCFVFDGRVAVGHGLEVRDYEPCPGCGWPLNQSTEHCCPG